MFFFVSYRITISTTLYIYSVEMYKTILSLKSIT